MESGFSPCLTILSSVSLSISMSADVLIGTDIVVVVAAMLLIVLSDSEESSENCSKPDLKESSFSLSLSLSISSPFPLSLSLS